MIRTSVFRHCRRCGELFKVYLSALKKANGGTYCSQECKWNATR